MRIKSAARKEQDDAEKREGDREGESDCKGGRCSMREREREGARHQLEASGKQRWRLHSWSAAFGFGFVSIKTTRMKRRTLDGNLSQRFDMDQ